MTNGMFMMPLCAFIDMKRDANADDVTMKWMHALQDASYHMVVFVGSIRNRVHPLQATGMS